MNFTEEESKFKDGEMGKKLSEEDYFAALDARTTHRVRSRKKVRLVLCHICCAEFGTTSLDIHQRTCRKEHRWGLDLVLHDENISKREAAGNRKQCCEPGQGPSRPVPSVTCKARDFDEYNADALAAFNAHAEKCLYCRERNHEAIENSHLASKILAIHKEHSDEDNEERHRQEEKERHRHEEEKLKHALEEEEAHRKAEEEEEAHYRAEEEAKRKHNEELAAMEEAARLQQAEEEEEAEQRHAEIEKSLHLLKERRNKALAEAENIARKHELEKHHRLEEEELLKKKQNHKEQRATRKAKSDEDIRMMKLLKEERELQRLKMAEETLQEKRRAALNHRQFLRKHDGVLASSQSCLVHKDKEDDLKAMDDIAHMSLAHANREHLIHDHHKLGGESFHASHTGCQDR